MKLQKKKILLGHSSIHWNLWIFFHFVHSKFAIIIILQLFNVFDFCLPYYILIVRSFSAIFSFKELKQFSKNYKTSYISVHMYLIYVSYR